MRAHGVYSPLSNGVKGIFIVWNFNSMLAGFYWTLDCNHNMTLCSQLGAEGGRGFILTISLITHTYKTYPTLHILNSMPYNPQVPDPALGFTGVLHIYNTLLPSWTPQEHLYTLWSCCKLNTHTNHNISYSSLYTCNSLLSNFILSRQSWCHAFPAYRKSDLPMK